MQSSTTNLPRPGEYLPLTRLWVLTFRCICSSRQQGPTEEANLNLFCVHCLSLACPPFFFMPNKRYAHTFSLTRWIQKIQPGTLSTAPIPLPAIFAKLEKPVAYAAFGFAFVTLVWKSRLGLDWVPGT